MCFGGYFWKEKNADADARKNSSLVCIADALFSVSSLGRFRHRSPQEPVVFTSQQTGGEKDGCKKWRWAHKHIRNQDPASLCAILSKHFQC